MDKKKIYEYIETNAESTLGVSHKVWEFAELSLKEYRSAALYVEELKKAGKEGNPKAVRFPRARVKDTLDFSFSGLKTAVVRYAESSEDDIKDITASFQAAVVDVLVSHTFKAARERGVKQVLVAGGVAANSGLKNAMTEKGKRTGIAVSVPPMVLCTDNAAMIAAAAYYNYDKYLTHDLRLDCKASEPIGL